MTAVLGVAVHTGAAAGVAVFIGAAADAGAVRSGGAAMWLAVPAAQCAARLRGRGSQCLPLSGPPVLPGTGALARCPGPVNTPGQREPGSPLGWPVLADRCDPGDGEL